MTSLASRTIEALRREHDALASLVPAFAEDDLAKPSGSSDWSVAQVLSHLGSGAEISLASLQVAQGGRDALGDGFNRSVWDRWDAMTPAEQRAGFLEHDDALVGELEALTHSQRDSLEVSLGFLPSPVSLAAFAGLRLGEVAHHTWDVRVAVDPEAVLLEDSAVVHAEHLSTDLGFMLGFLGKADRIEESVVLGLSDSGYSLIVSDTVALESDAGQATATFTGALEAALRLITGRLTPTYTPPSATVTGNVSLDDLRAVFPGF
ncbi:MAG TPA: maleylpyruvate isomerase N-terminal domain-containing protein [Marmoricola sp.]|nr:maleylpyruvate isomerase N-terminal domain-containing protein [Marmoricola sp.]